ncbi:MAG: hypothetical protein U9R19_07840, partial [Bacteroidota bacterium]|nr:hypothetical protein [Bacteroidota bacterium]
VFDDGDNNTTNIIDLNGVALDTIRLYPIKSFSFNDNTNELLISSFDMVYAYNIINSTYREYCQYYESHFATRRVWINDFEFIWATNRMDIGGSINLTNTITRKTICLKSYCNAKVYLRLDYSKHLNKVIWEKYESEVVGYNLLAGKYSIVMMDVDGTNEQEIEIL